MAAKTMRAAKPIVMPTPTCCSTTPNAAGSSSTIVGAAGSTAWAARATRNESASFTRTGTLRIDSTGAEVNSASTRRKGHRIGVSHAINWVSVKVSTATASADHAGYRLEHAPQVVDQHAEHPGTGHRQHGHRGNQLGYERQRRLVNLRGRLEDADDQADDQHAQQHRGRHGEQHQQAFLAESHDLLGFHHHGLIVRSWPPAIPAAGSSRRPADRKSTRLNS